MTSLKIVIAIVPPAVASALTTSGCSKEKGGKKQKYKEKEKKEKK